MRAPRPVWKMFFHTRKALSFFSILVSVFFPAPHLPAQPDGYDIVSETVRTVTAYNVGDPHQTSPCPKTSGGRHWNSASSSLRSKS